MAQRVPWTPLFILYLILVPPPCLAQTWMYGSQSKWQGACNTAKPHQQSPVRISASIANNAKQEAQKWDLHVNYNDWRPGDFQAQDDSPFVNLTWSRSNSSPGHVYVGPLSALARKCTLRSIGVHNPPEHTFDPDVLQVHSNAAFASVVVELQLLHSCETEAGTTANVQQATHAIVSAKKNITNLQLWVQKLKSNAGNHVSDMANYLLTIKAAEKAVEEAKETLVRLKQEKIHEETVHALDSSWHRADLADFVIVSVFVTPTFGNDESQLLRYVLSHGATEQNSQRLQADGSSLVLPIGSSSVIVYRGSLTVPPCSHPVDWFLITSPLEAGADQLHQIAAMQPGNSSSRTRQEVMSGTKFRKSHADTSRLGNPGRMRTPEEKTERTKKYGILIASMMAGNFLVYMLFAGSIAWETCERVEACCLLSLSSVATFLALCVGAWSGYAAMPSVSQDTIGESFLQLRRTREASSSSSSSSSGLTGFLPFILEGLLTIFALAFVCVVLLGSINCFLFSYLGLFLVASIFTGICAGWLWLVRQYTWLAWTTSCPLANFLVNLVMVLPMSLTLFAFPWLTLPLYAYFNGAASCTDGADWEVHTTVVLVWCLQAFHWLVMKAKVLCKMHTVTQVYIYIMFMLASIDMYTDAVFIAIAKQCDSFYSNWAAYAFIFGVVGLQWLGSVIPTLLTGSTGAATWQGLMFPMELHAESADTFINYPGGQAGDLKVNLQFMKGLVVVVSVFRTFGEDIPQCIIQWEFTQNVKRNPMILFSISISLITAVMSIGKVYTYLCRSTAGYSLVSPQEPE